MTLSPTEPPTMTLGSSDFPCAYDPAEDSPTVRALARSWGPFDAAIHRDDSMFRHAVDQRQGSRELALFEYFRSGREGADAALALLRSRLGPDLAGRRILELGCGFGRVTRFLRGALAESELLSAELEPGALDFQARRFGADRGIPSRRPEDLASLAGRLDGIFAWSVLSHLPRDAFAAWLAALIDCLAPGGLLLASVHGAQLRPADVAPDPDGFAFVGASESSVLPGEQYGTSWVETRWIADRLPDHVEARVARRGLWDLQDLWVIARAPADAPDPGTLLRRPTGVLEACRLHDRSRLRLQGWAVGSESAELAELAVRLDGVDLFSGPTTSPRGDVATRLGLDPDLRVGFLLELDTGAVPPGGPHVLEVEARDGAGSTLLHCGPVDSTTLWLRAADLEARLGRATVALDSWERGRWGSLRRWARRLGGRTGA